MKIGQNWGEDVWTSGVWTNGVWSDGLGPDTTPDAFSFVDQGGVALSTVITSAAVTLSGFDTPTPYTITNGTGDINGSGTFSASPGDVSAGDTIRLRHTSSATNGDSVVSTGTVGGVSATFTSTTLAIPGTNVLGRPQRRARYRQRA